MLYRKTPPNIFEHHSKNLCVCGNFAIMKKTRRLPSWLKMQRAAGENYIAVCKALYRAEKHISS